MTEYELHELVPTPIGLTSHSHGTKQSDSTLKFLTCERPELAKADIATPFNYAFSC